MIGQIVIAILIAAGILLMAFVLSEPMSYNYPPAKPVPKPVVTPEDRQAARRVYIGSALVMLCFFIFCYWMDKHGF